MSSVQHYLARSKYFLIIGSFISNYFLDCKDNRLVSPEIIHRCVSRTTEDLKFKTHPFPIMGMAHFPLVLKLSQTT